MEVYPFHKHEVAYEHNELKFRALVEMTQSSGSSPKRRG